MSTEALSSPEALPPIEALPIFVAHVRTGYEARAELLERQMKEHGLTFEYMLDGDIADLDQAILDRWFKGVLHKPCPTSSCVTKHFLIMEQIIARDLPAALILEDDALLDRRFNELVNQALKELGERDHRQQAWYVNLENSGLRFVPADQRRPGQVLYPASRGRCAGAYIISQAFARLVIERADRDRTEVSPDTFMDPIIGEEVVDGYWLEPTVVEQGSHNVLFDSGLEGRYASRGRRFGYRLRKFIRSWRYRLGLCKK